MVTAVLAFIRFDLSILIIQALWKSCGNCDEESNGVRGFTGGIYMGFYTSFPPPSGRPVRLFKDAVMDAVLCFACQSSVRL